MNLTEYLKEEADRTYMVAENLVRLVDDKDLGWKPATGANWMSVGQLLRHISEACGSMIKGFVSGDWGLPDGMTFENMPAEMMMPTADGMPSVESVAEALALLKADRETTLRFLDRVPEESLLTRMTAAPWGGPERNLLHHLQSGIDHLNQHKGQLFYYLKLQGKPVHTGHLWGE